MSSIKRYQGLVEFLAHRPDIMQRVEAGYSGRMIFDALREKNKITMSYGAFMHYLRRFQNDKKKINQAIQPYEKTKLESAHKKNAPVGKLGVSQPVVEIPAMNVEEIKDKYL